MDALSPQPGPFGDTRTGPPGPLTAVMTCKGRLAHLQQSLPRLAAQEGLSIVVVDYGCPDHAGDWVRRHFPQVQVVMAPDASEFSIARARNLGAAQVHTPWIAFIDADVLVDPGFLYGAMPLLQEGSFLVAEPCPHELAGFLVCRRDDFRRVGGYDDVFTGWGSEDRDLCVRLERLGARRRPFASAALQSLPHTDADRTRFHAITDRFVSLRINGMYFQIKHDLARLTGLPDLPQQDRVALYARVRDQVLARPGDACQIDAALPARCDFLQPPDWRLRRMIRYRFEPNEPSAP